MPKENKEIRLSLTVEERQAATSCHAMITANVIGGGKQLLLVLLLLLALLMNTSCVECARDHRKQTNLEAKVGSHVVFNCYIDFPYDSPIPYIVHWSKDVSSPTLIHRLRLSTNDERVVCVI